jgi:hypothetical protein
VSDHTKFSAAVSRALEDETLREMLRQNALGLRARYCVDTMVEEYVLILCDATNDAGLARRASPT